MMKSRLFFIAPLFALAAQAAPVSPAVTPAASPTAPAADNSPRLGHGFLIKHGEKLVFSPCRDRVYVMLEDASADRQVGRGLEMAGLADGRTLYVELFGVLDGNTLRASGLNLALADGRCQRPGGSDEAWLASGNDPGWMLAAGGEKVSLQRQGAPDVNLPYRIFTRQGEVAQFSGEGPEGRLDVRFEKKLCRDSRGGAIFGWTATIQVDGQSLQGCAWQR